MKNSLLILCLLLTITTQAKTSKLEYLNREGRVTNTIFTSSNKILVKYEGMSFLMDNDKYYFIRNGKLFNFQKEDRINYPVKKISSSKDCDLYREKSSTKFLTQLCLKKIEKYNLHESSAKLIHRFFSTFIGVDYLPPEQNIIPVRIESVRSKDQTLVMSEKLHKYEEVPDNVFEDHLKSQVKTGKTCNNFRDCYQKSK
ncbi:MAG: hypothetical protein VYA54_06800 [Bdellovibrionota bacterium]|nr:hypothetical protein [Bdellovibrionota bacterium]